MAECFKKMAYSMLMLCLFIGAVTTTPVPATSSECQRQADIIFALDASDSINTKSFKAQKDFVASFLGEIKVDGHKAFRVGVLAFSKNQVEIPMLPVKTKEDIINKTNDIVQEKSGTNIAGALNKMRLMFLNQGRKTVTQIIVLITDGLTHNINKTLKEAELTRGVGIKIFAVAVGRRIDEAAMAKMTGDASKVFPVDSFRDLVTLTRRISDEVCSGDKPKGIDICRKCLIEQGTGYQAHERVCYFYYQCFSKNGEPIVMNCSPGMFWDQTALTCRLPTEVACASDPCASGDIKHYKILRTCSMYYTCKNFRTFESACCGPDKEYDSKLGCVPASNCTSECAPTTASQTKTKAPCDKKPDPDSDRSYIQTLSSGQVLNRPCPTDTTFSVATCSCSIHKPWPKKQGSDNQNACKPTLHMPLDSWYNDVINWVYIQNMGNVQIDNNPNIGSVGLGSARFLKTGKLSIPAYSNTYFGNKFAISLRYKPLPADTEVETIINNSDCLLRCSLAIIYNRTSDSTIAKINTRQSGGILELEVKNQNQVDGWNEVLYKYDGNVLSLTVNGITKSMPVSGNMLKIQGAVQVGMGCGDPQGYSGYIDEIKIYRNCLP